MNTITIELYLFNNTIILNITKVIIKPQLCKAPSNCDTPWTMYSTGARRVLFMFCLPKGCLVS